ncbi:MAG: hypothetical protein HN849_07430 [Victivallales bacterium]|jgi:hypothetical protein|nr:hypothetical protein [Victivallales bacterium]MBT7161179.1 hypothetical protein [Victivallales bacterium]MBT7299325.1 hypothetical protein [Victivallales bacterium]
MRKTCSIILYVIAGYFFYMVALLGFLDGRIPVGVKCSVLPFFMLPGAVSLCIGLALRGFRNWRRDTGIVVLSCAGFSALMVLTFLCMFASEELRKVIDPRAFTLFNDYLSGTAVTLAFAASGLLLIRADKMRAQQDTPAVAETQGT